MTKPNLETAVAGMPRNVNDEELRNVSGGRVITAVFSYGNFTMVISASAKEGATVATIIK